MKTALFKWHDFWKYQLLNLPLTLFVGVAILLSLSTPWVTSFSFTANPWIDVLHFIISMLGMSTFMQLIPLLYTFIYSQKSPKVLNSVYLIFYIIIVPCLSFFFLL